MKKTAAGEKLSFEFSECSPNITKPDCATKMIRYRQLRAIDFDALCQDVEK